MEDVSKNLFLRDAKMDILIIGVGALVDDAIHVQIEIVKFWNLRRKKKKYIHIHTHIYTILMHALCIID